MPFTSRTHHASKTPEIPIPPQPLASLVQAASQTLTGIAHPTVANTRRLQLHPDNLRPYKPSPGASLRVQTESAAFPPAPPHEPTSGITPIHSGASSAILSPTSADDDLPPKKSTAFRLPSPATQQQPPLQQRPHQQQRSESYQQQQQRTDSHAPIGHSLLPDVPPSAVVKSHIHSFSLPPQSQKHQQQQQQQQQYQQRPSDPTQKQQLANTSISSSYTAYHASNPSSATASRASTSASSATTPQRPSMHRNNTGSNSGGYSQNPSINASGDASGGRKYTHPGALTPTYPPSSQHGPSQSSSAQSHAHLGIGLSGMRDRGEEAAAAVTGAVSPGRWLCGYGLYAIDWCKWNPAGGGGNGYGRIAVGSYAEDSHNYIQVLDTRPGPADPQQPGAPTLEFTKLAEATHTYPITRVLWEPPSSKALTDLLATSGDHLRLWSLPSPAAANPGSSITSRNYQTATQKLTPLALLSNSKSTDFTAPLTSLDWNQVSPSLIITSSIDTTCTIWDIPTLTAKTQLIAHDKEVFDVRFMSNSVDVFASCGADGSVRMFDLRSLEHSTIIYEPGGNKAASTPTTAGAGAAGGERDAGAAPSGGSPVNSGAPPALLRLSASPHDQHLIATFCTDSSVVRILDVRQPGQALVELKGHNANVNCCEWNPGRRGVLAAGGDDCAVLVWDIFGAAGSNAATGNIKTEKGVEQERNPIAWWNCEVEVNNLSWSPSVNKQGSDWIGIVGGKNVWGLGV